MRVNGWGERELKKEGAKSNVARRRRRRKLSGTESEGDRDERGRMSLEW